MERRVEVLNWYNTLFVPPTHVARSCRSALRGYKGTVTLPLRLERILYQENVGPTDQARPEPSSLELWLARRRKTKLFATEEYEVNALEFGTELPIHRHPRTTETMVMVRGKLMEYFYNEKGELTDKILLEAGGDQPVLQIPVGQWHSLEVLEEGTVIFEAKDGKYEAMREEDVFQ